MIRRVLGLVSVVSAFGAVALFAPFAQAALVTFAPCDSTPLFQPFTQWGDSDYYKLAPGADFESSLAGWSLQGGAHQVGGSETFAVTGTLGSSSLSLPAGATAVSPSTCVDAAYPGFRFFSRTDTPGALVIVSAIYPTLLGNVTIPVGVVTPGTGWAPSPPLITGSIVPGLLSGGTANVSLQFTAVGGGAQIDDVLVDPFRSH